jgi:large subunit ribosomal protein L15
MPLQRRLPKRGFTNVFRKHYAIVNLKDLAKLDPQERITPDVLVQRGLVKQLGDGLKVLGDGEVKSPFQVSAHVFSKSAREKIEKAGGKAEVISA